MLSISNAFCIFMISCPALNLTWSSIFSMSAPSFPPPTHALISHSPVIPTYALISSSLLTRSSTSFQSSRPYTDCCSLERGRRQFLRRSPSPQRNLVRPRRINQSQPLCQIMTRMSFNHAVQGTNKHDSKVCNSQLPPTATYNGLRS
jgi:hypothetical protein